MEVVRDLEFLVLAIRGSGGGGSGVGGSGRSQGIPAWMPSSSICQYAWPKRS